MTDKNKKKYKILVMSDVLVYKSGVGSQMRYIVDHLDASGEFEIIALGGAIKHNSYEPFKDPALRNTLHVPVNGYGNPDIIRQAISIGKIDAIFKITDPRFYTWLYDMEDEIHAAGVPILYWTIWDNADDETWPRYNRHVYDSVDFLGAINKSTHSFLSKQGWADKTKYIPHGVPAEDFKILHPEEIKRIKIEKFGKEKENAFVLFYNSRNAYRKRTGSCIYAFKKFIESLPEKEQNNCIFLMKTPVHDQEGQHLPSLINDLGLSGKVAIADGHFSNNEMAEFYNISDVTISMSSEEGFGLSILESLMCGVPVVCTKTGGMQDQVLDPETGEEFGFCLQPVVRSLVGSQVAPYIFSDYISTEQVVESLKKIHEAFKSGTHKDKFAGERARASMLRRFNLETIQKQWRDEIVNQIELARGKKLLPKQIRKAAL